MNTRYDHKIHRKGNRQMNFKHMKRCSTSYIRRKEVFSLIRLAKIQKSDDALSWQDLRKQALLSIASSSTHWCNISN